MRRLALVLAALAALAGTPLSSPQAGVLPSARIMVVGDSLSHGYAGDWSWRFWVSRELHRQGVATDFVGPHRLPYRGTRYERAIPWDDDHAAAAGSTIDAHLGLIAGEMRRYKPDVLVVELGYNDLARGDDAATIVHQLQELVQRARLAYPTIRVLLSEITSTRSHEYDATAAAVNAQMSAWAPLNAVTMVNVMTGRGPGNLAWDPVRYTWDGLHPNAAGQTLFAQRVAEALQRAAVLPAAPALLFADRTWSPDARASVKVTNGRARVAWPTMTHELCVTGVRVLVDGVARTGWRVVPSLDTGVTLPLTPGDHVVQLVVRRGTMVSAPGAGVRVRA